MVSLISTLFHGLFFFNDTATTEIYTLSLHDALPISRGPQPLDQEGVPRGCHPRERERAGRALHPIPRRDIVDRKSTRLNSSHLVISYAVFCLKKKSERHRPSARPCGTLKFEKAASGP